MRRGLALVPEDRRKQGLHTDLSVARNIALTLRRTLSRGGILTSSAEYAVAHDVGRDACRSRRATSTRSPGRCPAATSRRSCWPSGCPPSRRVLIIDEPTRGIDVGTKAEVHRLLDRLAGRGRGGRDDLLGAARGARHERPGARHARGPRHRRPRPRRRGRGDRDGCGDGSQQRDRPHCSDAARRASRSRSSWSSSSRPPRTTASCSAPTASATCSWRRRCWSCWRSGQAAVIITRNVDLSVSSTLGLVAFATGSMFVAGLSDPRRHRARDPARRRARRGQRRAGHHRAGPVARHHARHALRLPRHHGDLGGQRPDQRRRHAAAASWPSAPRSGSGIPVLALVALAVVVVVGVYLGYARSGASSTRSGPSPTPPC